MTKLLIKNAKIIDLGGKHHLKKRDVLIENGMIVKIASRIHLNRCKLIESKNLHISPGFADIGTQICEPGLEQRDDLSTINKQGMNGGYTDLIVFPNTNPVIDQKSAVQYIKKTTESLAIDFHVIGAVSKNTAGIELSEMIDMHHHEAIAFSDGSKAIRDQDLLLRALQYVKSIDGIIIQNLSKIDEGHLNEGIISAQLGIEGSPDIFESAMIKRDIDITRYAASKIVFHTISTSESCKLLKQFKKTDKISATVSYLNLIFEENICSHLDPSYKVSPPLRNIKDRSQLQKSVAQFIIPAIVSNHSPLEEEVKKLPFSDAAFGAIGLESSFAALMTYCKESIPMETIIHALSNGPRKILNLEEVHISENEEAKITVFDPTIVWRFENKDNHSKSNNSPFLGHMFTGKVLGIVSGNQSFFNL